jgi:hypothetical protein
MQKLVMKIGNEAMKILLPSPLHSLVSRNTLLITMTGCKTGREYSLPVNYVQDGSTLYIMSKRCRTWWRNLRGGKSVRVWLRGQQVKGQATTDEVYITVVEDLKRFFQKRPDTTRYFGVRLEPDDQPNMQDIVRLAQERVLVKVSLNRKN